jgi:hypothetical protein
VKDNLIAMTWKEKQDVQILANIPTPPAESNFCDEQKKAQKHVTIKDTWQMCCQQRGQCLIAIQLVG